MARRTPFAVDLLPRGAASWVLCLALSGVLALAERPAQAQAPSVGSIPANPVVVGRMFANVCVAATNADGVEAALQQVGMVVNPETGTYFHQLFDLSVNPTGGACSMVFVTDQEDDAAMDAFRMSMVQTHGGPVPTFSINVRESNGESFVRARIEVPW